eukprot:gene626-115_t
MSRFVKICVSTPAVVESMLLRAEPGESSNDFANEIALLKAENQKLHELVVRLNSQATWGRSQKDVSRLWQLGMANERFLPNKNQNLPYLPASVRRHILGFVHKDPTTVKKETASPPQEIPQDPPLHEAAPIDEGFLQKNGACICFVIYGIFLAAHYARNECMMCDYNGDDLNILSSAGSLVMLFPAYGGVVIAFAAIFDSFNPTPDTLPRVVMCIFVPIALSMLFGMTFSGLQFTGYVPSCPCPVRMVGYEQQYSVCDIHKCPIIYCDWNRVCPETVYIRDEISHTPGAWFGHHMTRGAYGHSPLDDLL